ncbi:nicotinamide riboside transporter PnuC [Klugiella xanthotipulae]|uniref:Nicotinamide mononucleotide transporter n=1 Tax=Klugiella xanthotipulae TaxID=244735 RepID=A0A543I685_9MICO|nr:nicotinamide riboside transporter PnuC [Klugiella xanthotipulae]TQM66088.1 nicotinamide mononucleotide transporter [Klugiella xanthotipulae]
MDVLTHILTATAFTWGSQGITVAELLGFLTGALCVWGVTRQYTWNWPVGLANNVVFFGLFFSAGLYADAALQVVFALLAVYGWIVWSRGGRDAPGGAANAALPLRRASRRDVVVVLTLGVVALGVVGEVLTRLTDSTVPWPDAAVLVGSLLATWGQAKKILEQWWVWIAVDLVSIPLYLYKGLWLTAVLYVGFLALCVYGYRRWCRILGEQDGTASIPATQPVPETQEVAR